MNDQRDVVISGRTPRYGILNRLAYGVGEFFGGGCFVIINTFFIVFLTDALGMNAALAGTIPMVGKIWDAITDPIMGNITDRTKSRFGAKRLYILIGSFASAITFVLLWLNIDSPSMTMKYIFYIVMYCLFSTGFTVLSVPYNGLLPDMMDDYSMRARFSNIRMVFSTIGASACGLVPAFIIKDNTDADSYMRCAILFGILFFVCSITVFFGTWERQKEPIRTSLAESFPQAASVFRNRSYLLFLGLYLGGQCGMDFVSGMAVYYVKDVLHGYDKGWFMIIMAVLMVSQLIGMAIFGPLMSKTSKKLTILIAAPVRLIGVLGLLGFSYEGASLIPILVLAALIGLGNAGSLTAIFAIMADMTDIDEVITSLRRPGIVSSMATFIRKISAGLSAAAIGFMLSAVGYDEMLATQGIAQAASTQHGIGLCFIFAPAIMTVLLLIVGIAFPVTGKEFRVVQKEIARRKSGLDEEPTEEEKKILEKVTGYDFERLWMPENARLKNRSAD